MQAAEESGTDQVGSCIALPDSWSAPEVTMYLQSSEDAAATEVSLTSHADSQSELNNRYSRDGYRWECYIDQERDYTGDELGKIVYTLQGDDDTVMAMTTIGVLSGGIGRSKNNYIYSNLASHQLLKDNMKASYLTANEVTFAEPYQILDPAKAGVDNVYQSGDKTFFYSSLKQRLLTLTSASDSSGAYTGNLEGTPEFSEFHYFNNQIVLSKNENSKTFFYTSMDGKQWSEKISPELYFTKLQYDPANNLYVGLNTQASGKYFTSTDLENWDTVDVGIYQNIDSIFIDDGRSIMRTAASAAPLAVRDTSGTWSVVDSYPNSDYFYPVYDVAYQNGRFMVTLQENNADNDPVAYYFAYTEDMQNWTWKTLSAPVNTSLTIHTLGDNEIVLTGGDSQTIFYSQDNGATFSGLGNIAKQLNINTVADDSLVYIYDDLYRRDGIIYGSVEAKVNSIIIAKLHFTTKDFSEMTVWAADNNSQWIEVSGETRLWESADQYDWRLFSVTPATQEPEPATKSKKKKSGGAQMPWLMLLLASFGLIFRQSRLRN